MNITLKKVKYFKDKAFQSGDFSFEISPTVSSFSHSGGIVSNLNNCFVFPAFCDVHVHLREPGFSYKETVTSGTKAAARGGYTAVFSMPNLNPVPDSAENMKIQKSLIENGAVIKVYPYASITVGQKGEALSDFENLSKLCAGFSDDGRGVQSEELMREAMIKAKALNKIIVAHCEDNSLLNGGYIHDGEYARLHGHKGICSESEWKPIERDLKLAKETGCKYHVCHISCKESVELIRKAKAEGVDVTCETAPHYLVMNDMMLEENGRFKMNPPIRSEADRLALVEGLKDGTIDMIATDHAPHSAEEKSKGLEKSLMGVVGLETAFSVLYTKLVKTGVITLEKLIEVMSINPRRRFGLSETEDICVFDLNEEYTVNPDEFLSLGKATPFEGEKLFGVCKLTVMDGNTVFNNI
ncbi:MAG: dihydroorotase [Acutalibacteraceae bacterium]|nr:dihydroorotase [Acutalibacteraceae bacterium]